MKKLLSLVLLLALLVMSLGLVSCSDDESEGGANTGVPAGIGVSTGTIGDNPLQVYLEALQNTPTVFFGDNMGVVNTINSAINNGSISVDFNNPQLMGMIDSDLDSLGAVAATLFINRVNGTYGANASVSFDGKNYDSSAYISPSIIGAKDNGLLNVNGSYSANIDTIIETFPNTNLGKDLGVTSDMYSKFKSVINEAKKYLNDALANIQVPSNNIINTILKALKPTVAEETITIGNESIACVVVTYKINTTSIKDALVALYNDPSMSAYIPSNASSMADEMANEVVEEMTEIFNPDLTLKLCLNKADSTFAKVEVSGKVDYTDYIYTSASIPQEMYDDYYNTDACDEYNTFDDYYYAMTGEYPYGYEEVTYSVPVTASIAINKTDLVVSGNATIRNSTYGINGSISKATSGDDVKYTAKLSGSKNGSSIEVLNATATLNQNSGDFSITASLHRKLVDLSSSSKFVDSNGMFTATITGNASNAGGATITIAKASVGSFSIDIGLKLTFTAGQSAPMITGTDAATLTVDQAEDLLDKMEDSVIVYIFDQLF